ncbi:MAG: hypothetical protein ACJAS1_007223 [Oleiphilaceae bacterium]|jgi:hypothetical protein
MSSGLSEQGVIRIYFGNLNEGIDMSIPHGLPILANFNWVVMLKN